MKTSRRPRSGGALRTASGTRSRANTRRRLLAAALEVFAEKGLAGATVDDIVSSAGFTRGAFYSNFESKEEVFVEAYAQRASEAMKSAEAAIAAAPPAESATDYVLDILSRFQPLDRTWYLINSEFELLALRDPEFAARYAAQRSDYVAHLATMFAWAFTRIGIEPTVDPVLLVQMVMPVYMMTLSTAYIRGEDAEYGMITARAAIPALLSAFTRPIGSAQGSA